MSTSTKTPTDLASTVFDAQAQMLDVARQGSQSAAKALESWTGFLSDQAKAILPEGIELPLADSVPTPTKLVETSFDFAGDLLVQQRQLVSRLLEGVEGMVANGSTTTASKTSKAGTAGK